MNPRRKAIKKMDVTNAPEEEFKNNLLDDTEKPADTAVNYEDVESENSDFLDDHMIDVMQDQLADENIFNPESNLIDQLILERILGIENTHDQATKAEYQKKMLDQESAHERFSAIFKESQKATIALARQKNVALKLQTAMAKKYGLKIQNALYTAAQRN